MRISSIHVEKSRTIDVSGALKRDQYRKITFGANADILEGEDPLHEKEILIKFVDLTISEEVEKYGKERVKKVI